MIRPAAKICLEVLGVGIAAIAIFVIVLGWRLSQGPLTLSPLTPTFERELNRALTTFSVDIGDVALVWTRQYGGVAIHLREVKALDKNGGVIASLPRVGIDLSPKALLRGYLAPTTVNILNASATIVRRQDGSFQLGFADAGTQQNAPSTQLIRTVLTALAAPNAQMPLTQYLRRFRIREGSLTLYDQTTRSKWHAPNANLEFVRNESGLQVELDANLEVGRGVVKFNAEGNYNSKKERALIRLAIGEFRPAALAIKSPALTELRNFNLPVSGRARLIVDHNGRLNMLAFNIEARRGYMTLPFLSPEPMLIDRLALGARYDPVRAQLTIDELSYTGEEQKGELEGAISLHFGEGLHVAGFSGSAQAKDVLLTAPAIFEGAVRFDTLIFSGTFDGNARRTNIKTLAIDVGKARLRASGNITQAAATQMAEMIAQPAAPDILTGKAPVLADTSSLKSAKTTKPVRALTAENPCADTSSTPSPGMKLKATLSGMDVATLKQIWPRCLAQGGRRWTMENISKGALPTASIAIDAQAGELDLKPIPDKAVAVKFDFQGLQIRFMRQMPPLMNVSGNATVSGNHFEMRAKSAAMDTGKVRKIEVREGRFTTKDFHIPGNNGQVEAVFSGALSDILTILDNPPLEFAKGYGLDPRTLGGAGTVRLEVSLPLRDALLMKDVKFGVAANINGLTYAEIAEGYSLSAGKLAIKANGAGLFAEGTAALNGTPVGLRWSEDFTDSKKLPTVFVLSANLDEATRKSLGVDTGSFLSGPLVAQVTLRGHGPDIREGEFEADLTPSNITFLSLNYKKPAGVQARAFGRFAFTQKEIVIDNAGATGDRLDIGARFVLDREWRLQSMQSERAVIGDTARLQASVVRQRDNSFLLTLRGQQIDGRGLGEVILGTESQDKAKPDEPSTALRVDAAVEKVVMNNGVELSALRFTMLQEGDSLRTLDLSGKLPDNSTVTARVAANAGNKRTVNIDSSNAGALLKGLDYFKDMMGGNLHTVATIDDTQVMQPMQGNLTVEDFRISDALVLAKILSIASFTGVNNLLTNNGIAFKKLTMPFTAANGLVEIKDARLYGAALGLTVEGWVNEREDRINLTGSIVPAYTINSMIGAVPLVGDLLVGRKGEGIFGITYAISGPPNDPEVSVNPLSAFAPGFLRRLFEIGKEKPVQNPDNTQRDVN